MFRITAVIFVLVIAGNQGRTIKNLQFPHGRIVNRVPAQPGEFPSQVSLQVDDSHWCGASIVNEYYALTAAHCVHGDPGIEKYMSAYAGSISSKTGGTRHQLVELILHEDYDPDNSWVNDIAVVKVETPFVMDGVNVSPVVLPKSDAVPDDGSPAVAIGWGYTDNTTHVLPTYLNKVDLAISNIDKCNNTYMDTDEGLHVYGKQICAETTQDGAHGTCGGDSGGPLFVDGAVVGLVSWGFNGCATPGYATVFTRVSAYIDWIKEKTAS